MAIISQHRTRKNINQAHIREGGGCSLVMYYVFGGRGVYPSFWRVAKEVGPRIEPLDGGLGLIVPKIILFE